MRFIAARSLEKESAQDGDQFPVNHVYSIRRWISVDSSDPSTSFSSLLPPDRPVFSVENGFSAGYRPAYQRVAASSSVAASGFWQYEVTFAGTWQCRGMKEPFQGELWTLPQSGVPEGKVVSSRFWARCGVGWSRSLRHNRTRIPLPKNRHA